MSNAAQNVANTKATASDNTDGPKSLQPQQPAAQLEEDDEFEDFPVEGISSPNEEISVVLYDGRRLIRDFRLGKGRRNWCATDHTPVGGELG